MAEWDRAVKWRQGFFLTPQSLIDLGLCASEVAPGLLGIVATHDCDLTQSPNVEPQVEILLGSRIEEVDGNCTHAKTARKLHLTIGGITPCFGEFVATEKHLVSKDRLFQLTADPSLKLEPAELITFRGWLADRYRRSAFPDAFESALKTKGVESKIKATAKKHAKDVSALLFDLEEGQNPAFLLDIIVLYPDEPDYEKALSGADAMVAALKSEFTKAFKVKDEWHDIELRYIDAISESALSFADYKKYKPWRLDYLSYAAEKNETSSMRTYT